MNIERIDHWANVNSAVAEPRLRTRIINASAWNLLGQIAGQAIRFASNLIMTRILAPDAFGVMAIVYVVSVGLGMFSDLGINKSLTQNSRAQDQAYIDTAWTLQVIRGIVLAAITIAIALLLNCLSVMGLVSADTVYADARLPIVLAGFSIVAILQGAEPTRVILAKRLMKYSLLVRIDLLSQLFAIIVMLAMAWFSHSIAALVVGAVAQGAMKNILSWFILPGQHERFKIDTEAAKELLGIARWLVVGSSLGFLGINGDRVLLGMLLDAKIMGAYSIAFMLASTLQAFSTMMCTNVIFYALSEVQRNNPDQLEHKIRQFQWASDAIFVTSSMAIFVTGTDIINILYDKRYEDAGWMLQMLALGIIGTRHQITEQCFLLLQKPNYITASALSKLLMIVIGMIVGNHYFGLPGAITGIVASQFAAWPIAIHFRINNNIWNYRSELFLLPSIIAGTGLGFIMKFVLQFLRNHHQI